MRRTGTALLATLLLAAAAPALPPGPVRQLLTAGKLDRINAGLAGRPMSEDEVRELERDERWIRIVDRAVRAHLLPAGAGMATLRRLITVAQANLRRPRSTRPLPTRAASPSCARASPWTGTSRSSPGATPATAGAASARRAW